MSVFVYRAETCHRRTTSGAVVLATLAVASLFTGCAVRRVAEPAPVEDRSGVVHTSSGAAAATSGKALPGAENAGKPGYYTVQAGDTLYRIALDSGQTWRDVQAWNNLANPNVIEVGQVLRISPPVNAPAPVSAGAVMPAPTATGVTASPVTASSVVSRPLSATGTVAAAGSVTATVPAPAPAPAPVPASVPSGDAITMIWPAQGTVVSPFDEAKNKGVGIGGKVGDPVVAAADGRVVYAGAGLRGYGNLIILKHNNTYLTAYAHNQALLVREDQTVKQGQKIAEMGSSDADRVKLHFEVRRNGKPVDPVTFLPKR